jgi:hypothetical protein
MARRILQFGGSERHDFGFQPLVARHRMHEMSLWNDDELVALLDRHPRARLQAFTMGSDRTRYQDWRYVDPGDASGKEILRAVSRGRLWLNLLRADLADSRIGALTEQVTSELAESCPRMRLLRINFATLLISSPSAMVYYHLDASHQCLWHLRGFKRIWLYPACDERFVSRELLEDILGGFHEHDEEVPYSPGFDDHAAVFDLTPGDAASWPQNAPHRIENLGTLNVSLSTGFVTDAADRRNLVYSANRFFRRRFRLPTTSTQESGLRADAKCFAYRLCRRAGLVPKGRVPSYPRDLRIDADAEPGYRPAGR